MAAGGHFVKKNESCIFIWNGQKCKQKLISDIQNGCRQPFLAKKNENCVLIWNGEKCKQKWISDIQNGHRRPFEKIMNHFSTIFKGAGHLIYDSILFYMFRTSVKKSIFFKIFSWKFAIHKELFDMQAVLAWTRSRFVLGLHSRNMNGFFWILVCRLVIVYGIIENENRVIGKSKNGDFGAIGGYIIRSLGDRVI